MIRVSRQCRRQLSRRRRFALLACVTLACAACVGDGEEKHVVSTTATTVPTTVRVFSGPKFYTGDGDIAAIAVDSNGIITSLHETLASAPKVPVTSLPGEIAFPGFHDAHLHLEGIGRRDDEVDLRGATSPSEVVARVRKFLDDNPTASIVNGRGWDQSKFPTGAYPVAQDLASVDGVPVFLRRVDGHATWVNPRVLKETGVRKETPNPDGGEIVRDADGNPTGVFIDNAVALLDRASPAPTDDDIRRRLLRGLQSVARAGLTSVHDMGMSPRSFQLLNEIARTSSLPVRVFVYLDGEDPASFALLSDEKRTPSTAPMVTLKGIKLYADGAMGSRGALLLDDYSDAVGHRGLLLTSEKILAERVHQTHQRGGQVAIHAIGDGGVRRALEVIALAQGNDPSRRHRVEHAQFVSPADFAGFAQLGVIASMQPVHCTSDMHWVEARLGVERARTTYAWRSMITHGVPLAFGSDAPVEDERPQFGVYAALTRALPDADIATAFHPAEKLFLREAIDAFTLGAAIAVSREGDLGAFQPGMQFDVTLFSRDPRTEPKGWLSSEPVGTIIAGRVVDTTHAP